MTKEEKAWKIAMFEGWTQHPRNTVHWYLGEYGKDRIFFYEELVRYFSSFDGLMPIVERVNTSDTLGGFEITYFEFTAWGDNREHRHFQIDDGTLIDVLQDAILFYHENKETK